MFLKNETKDILHDTFALMFCLDGLLNSFKRVCRFVFEFVEQASEPILENQNAGEKKRVNPTYISFFVSCFDWLIRCFIFYGLDNWMAYTQVPFFSVISIQAYITSGR